MKLRMLSIFSLLVFQLQAVAEPVIRTTLEEAITKAPVILLVEEGKQQYDDLKDGVVVKTDTMEFECRKQTFKILKVLRNTTALKLGANSTVDVNAKSNACLVYPMSLKRIGNKLVVDPEEGAQYTVDIKNTHEKKFLFLEPKSSDPKTTEHYGWFVSPQHYSDELDKKLSSLPPVGKKTVQMSGDCN